jgi:hypothetical protein
MFSTIRRIKNPDKRIKKTNTINYCFFVLLTIVSWGIYKL